MTEEFLELKCKVARSQLATALDLFLRDKDCPCRPYRWCLPASARSRLASSSVRPHFPVWRPIRHESPGSIFAAGALRLHRSISQARSNLYPGDRWEGRMRPSPPGIKQCVSRREAHAYRTRRTRLKRVPIGDPDGDLVSSQAARAGAISIAETGMPQGMTLALEERSESGSNSRSAW